MMRKTVCTFALVLVTLASSAAAQDDDWRHRWFWGAQGGIMQFKTASATTPTSGWQNAITHSALYAAFDHVIFDTTFAAVQESQTTFRDIQFSSGRRIQALLYVFPSGGYIQPYFGGGFGINQLTDAFPTGVFNTL